MGFLVYVISRPEVYLHFRPKHTKSNLMNTNYRKLTTGAKNKIQTATKIINTITRANIGERNRGVLVTVLVSTFL